MILENNQIILRLVLFSDAQDILNLRSNEIVNQYIKRIPPKTIADAEYFIKYIHERTLDIEMLFWGISVKNSSKIIGTICLWKIPKDQKTAELGYELLPDFHGKGIMNDAVKLVLDFGFRTKKFGVITAFTNKDNQSSIKLLKKNTFILIKEKKDKRFPDNLVFSAKNFIL